MQLWKDSEYSSVLNIPGFCICKRYKRFWICLNMAEKCLYKLLTRAGFWICLVKYSQGFEYASGSRYARAQNIAMLWICESYTRSWICLDKPKSKYALKMLNMLEYTCIYLDKQSFEYARILNVSYAVHRVKSLYTTSTN